MVVDTVVLVILFISAFVAFWRGFIREFVTICGAAGGFVAAWMAGPHLKPLFRSLFDVKEGQAEGKLFGLLPYGFVADALSYLVVFIIVFAVLSFLSHVLSEKARAVGLGPVDRTLGVIFGLVRGLLIVGLLYLPVHLWGNKDMKKQWFEKSNTHVYVEATADWIAKLLPKDMQGEQAPKIETPTTRDALEALDVLKGAGNSGENNVAPSENDLKNPGTKGTETGKETGYDAQSRKTLDQILDEQQADPTSTEKLNP